MPKFLTKDEARLGIDECRKAGVNFIVKFEKVDGEIRTMTCHPGNPDAQFVKGSGDGEREQEDTDNDCVTLFSLDRFSEQVADGVQRIAAGRRAWRRVRLTHVIRIERV